MSTDFIKFNEVSRGPDTEFEVRGLSAVRVYAFQVVAGNFAGEGEASKAVFVGTNPGAPLAPAKAPTVRGVGATWVEVAWGRARCNGSLIENYTVDVSLKSAPHIHTHIHTRTPIVAVCVSSNGLVGSSRACVHPAVCPPTLSREK